jgi:hypothetical protein
LTCGAEFFLMQSVFSRRIIARLFVMGGTRSQLLARKASIPARPLLPTLKIHV